MRTFLIINRYNAGVNFKHNDIDDLCDKIKFVLSNLIKFNTRDYILDEECCTVSQKKLEDYFIKLFRSKGLLYKHLKGHIFRLGKGSGTDAKSFYNSNLKDIERLTMKIRSHLD